MDLVLEFKLGKGVPLTDELKITILAPAAYRRCQAARACLRDLQAANRSTGTKEITGN